VTNRAPLFDAIVRSDADRSALIGRFHASADVERLARLLMNLQRDGEPARLHLSDSPRQALS